MEIKGKLIKLNKEISIWVILKLFLTIQEQELEQKIIKIILISDFKTQTFNPIIKVKEVINQQVNIKYIFKNNSKNTFYLLF